MIVGGYNIIDFDGKVFDAEVEVELSDEIINKFLDNSKPVLVGNFHVNVDGVDFYVNPFFAAVNRSEDGLFFIGSLVVVQITISTKKATFNTTA